MQIPIESACQIFLPELARLLLPAEINCKDFIALVKLAYIKTVLADYGKEGRPASISMVSRLTGLTRIDIRTILASEQECTDDSPESDRIYQLTNLLRDWHQDSLLTGKDGKPLLLSVTGSGATFESLVRRYFPKESFRSVLDELRDVGAIQIDNNTEVQVLRNYYLPKQGSDRAVQRLGSVVSDFLRTITYNFYRTEHQGSRLESRTVQKNVPISSIPEFRLRLESEITAVYQRLDLWLSENADDAMSDSEEFVRAGFGVYQIESK